MSIDWGTGCYEPTGQYLLPASAAVIKLSEPLQGRSVVDVGCGTGNAALLAAIRGAFVTGVDPAARLLEVARARASDQGLDIAFVRGEAASLPVPDDSADLVISVFGTIFAPDAEAAIAELVRVTAADGRIRLTAWHPGGPLSVINRTSEEFMGEVFGEPIPSSEPRPLAWHDPEALQAAFAPHGFTVEAVRRTLTFTDRSPEEYLEKWSRHPMAVSAMAALAGRPDAAELEADLRSRLLAAFRLVNEDPGGFRYLNEYVVVTARPADVETGFTTSY